jgi:hypothetical protein
MKIILCAAMALFAAGAAAQTPAPDQAPAAEQGKPAKPAKVKKVCRRENSSASRLGGNLVCLTAQEWAERDSASQRGADAMSRQGGQ